MNDQYIPDMTERFPEGLDGVDYTDNYFVRSYSGHNHDPYFSGAMENEYEPCYGEAPEEKEYLDKMNFRINNISSFSNEELQQFMDELLDEYEPEEIEACKYSVDYALKTAIEAEWDKREIDRQVAPKSYFIAWYNDTNNAEGEDKYEIYHAVDLDDARNLAVADLGDDVLIEIEPYEP